VYGIALFLLVLTLLVGSGAGTAAGSKSWLAIGGHRFGQPAELAKLAVILMLARQLAAMREPPSTLRDLIAPALIAGIPCLLVLKQPDLGSAIVFVAILFFMLFWAGTKPSLLLLASSPVIGLVLAFSTVSWGRGLRKGRKNDWRFCRRSTPTSYSRSWVRSWGSSACSSR